MPPEPSSERRSERARRAVLDAVYELATSKGYAKLTIEAIASRAGVGKPTIYRWWSCKGAVALDALDERLGAASDLPDTGDVAADLAAQITSVTAMLTGDLGRVYRGIIGEAQSDPELMETVREIIVDPRVRVCRERLDRAVAAGQLRADVPTAVMVDLFYAPVYYRFLMGFDDADVERSGDLVREVLRGLSTST